MIRRQAFKFELRPSKEQSLAMGQIAGSCRFVFNKALAMQKNNYENGGKFLNYVKMANILSEWKNDKETRWLRDAPAHPLQQSLKDLERAYKNFFAGRAEFPCFKRKRSRGSFRYPDGKQFKLDAGNKRIFLPKLGWMKLRLSREVIGTPKNATVSCSAGKWFISIQTEREVEEPVHQKTTAIGIDVGVVRFATLSDGSYIMPLNSFRKQEKRLARYQRAIARKVKFSNNWKKANKKVQRVHAKIANSRNDFLHKNSTQISKNHAMICVEDLQICNMTKSSNSKKKSGLNKSILDQGWGEFRRQLGYKLNWNGGILVAVPPQNTSRTCPACGHISKDNRKSQAHFECVECGFSENADLVGALNILALGHSATACGLVVQSNHSVKQEPSESSDKSLETGIPCL